MKEEIKMNSKIFRRFDGSYTMNEFEEKNTKRVQNRSIIPPKYVFNERLSELRRKAKN